MKILFLHGWQSVPGGVKPTCLAQHGYEIIKPMLPDEDFERQGSTSASKVVGSSQDRGDR
jgi:hypothetical protein